MTILTFRFSGLQDATKALEKVKEDLENNMQEILLGGGQLIRGEAIRSIQSGAKSGKTYKRYNPTRTHKASAPGEAPASDTGTLASSISIDVDVERNAVVGKIIAYADDGSGDNYAKHLEFGTQNMSARPFMQPALRKSRRKINQIFKREGVIR